MIKIENIDSLYIKDSNNEKIKIGSHVIIKEKQFEDVIFGTFIGIIKNNDNDSLIIKTNTPIKTHVNIKNIDEIISVEYLFNNKKDDIIVHRLDDGFGQIEQMVLIVNDNQIKVNDSIIIKLKHKILNDNGDFSNIIDCKLIGIVVDDYEDSDKILVSLNTNIVVNKKYYIKLDNILSINLKNVNK